MQSTKLGALAKQRMNTLIVAYAALSMVDLPKFRIQERRKPGPWMRGRKPRRKKYHKKKRR